MKLKTGNWWQEPKQRPKPNGAYRLVLTGLFSYASYTVQAYLTMGDTVRGVLGPPTSARNQENDPIETHMDQFGGANSSNEGILSISRFVVTKIIHLDDEYHLDHLKLCLT